MKNKSAVLFLLPGSVLLIFFLFIPLCSVLWPTIFEEGLSFSAYIDFFKDEYYVEILVRTLRIAIIATIVCAIMGVPTSYFISRCSKKWKGILIAVSDVDKFGC